MSWLTGVYRSNAIGMLDAETHVKCVVADLHAYKSAISDLIALGKNLTGQRYFLVLQLVIVPFLCQHLSLQLFQQNCAHCQSSRAYPKTSLVRVDLFIRSSHTQSSLHSCRLQSPINGKLFLHEQNTCTILVQMSDCLHRIQRKAYAILIILYMHIL